MRTRNSDWEVYLRTASYLDSQPDSKPNATKDNTTPWSLTEATEGKITPWSLTEATEGKITPFSEVDPTEPKKDLGLIEEIVDFGERIVDGIINTLFHEIQHLPLREIYPNIPAIPVSLSRTVDTLGRVLIRTFQTKQALQGLSNRYELGGYQSYGRDFLYNKKIRSKRVTVFTEMQRMLSPNSTLDFAGVFLDMAAHEATRFKDWITDPVELTDLSIESPDQWTISWTTFPEVYQNSTKAGLDSTFASTMTNADEATAQFWPCIAKHGLAYNLLILKKVDSNSIMEIRETLHSVWSPNLTDAFEANRLYMIDLRLFETLNPQEANNLTRFTPASLVLLTQDPVTKLLTPIAVRISGHDGDGAQVYSRDNGTSDSAWIYALLAAKTSITVFGIWLGHVYQWHIVTAAMVMTMKNNLREGDPVYQILSPQSNYLIGFNNVLLLAWSTAAPPTSIASTTQFLSLINQFAKDRNFFDDDPIETLKRNGIEETDFSEKTPWDRYEIVGQMMQVWKATQTYIQTVVNELYPTDASVAEDNRLEKWLADSGPNGVGNVRGLPATFSTRSQLAQVLTSMIYRITVHGSARLNSTPNPAMTFVPNFPPCLQLSKIPPPKAAIDIKTLMTYLPKTGTIGEMLDFYFIFAFSVPYEPFIPLEGIDEPESMFYSNTACNSALLIMRLEILRILHELSPEMPQIFQWPLNIET